MATAGRPRRGTEGGKFRLTRAYSADLSSEALAKEEAAASAAKAGRVRPTKAGTKLPVIDQTSERRKDGVGKTPDADMHCHARNTSKGFTLVEILVVIIIITVLASLVTVNIIRKPGEARTAAARLQMESLRNALQLYQTEQGMLPSQAQGLQALVSPATVDPTPTAFPAGGYLSKPVVPPDPWGGEYIYLTPGRQGEPFEIISYGRDGEPGGAGEDADLSSSDA